MSPFLIFAISLTIAYAIYYAVMITRDLYGKKEEAKSNEEVFDISNITEEEAAVAVNESNGGFSVADKQYDTSFQDGTSYDEDYGMGTESNGTNGCSPGADSSDREDDVDEDEENDVNQQKPKNAAESLQEKMDEQMESTSPIWIDGLWQDDFTESQDNQTSKRYQSRMKFSHIIKNVVSSFVFALLPLSASAKCGNVDYSWGADALAGMHDYVVTMMLYVLYLTYAVAAVMVIISALQIYIKMNTGEDGVTKSILTLIGACLFMIGASILFPAFFGYQI